MVLTCPPGSQYFFWRHKSQPEEVPADEKCVWKERGGGGITKYGIHSESF